jgi:hypothetical protein
MDETSPQLLITDIRSAMEDISLPTKLHDEESANKIITAYLTEGVEEFRELNRLRKEVSTSKCTRDFCGGRLPQASGVEQSERRQLLRQTACCGQCSWSEGCQQVLHDDAEHRQRAPSLYQGVHRSRATTGPSAFPGHRYSTRMFLYTAMHCNSHASAVAYSLPVEDSGYEVLFPGTPNVEIKYMDVTMLAEDMGAGDISQTTQIVATFFPRSSAKIVSSTSSLVALECSEPTAEPLIENVEKASG